MNTKIINFIKKNIVLYREGKYQREILIKCLSKNYCLVIRRWKYPGPLNYRTKVHWIEKTIPNKHKEKS